MIASFFCLPGINQACNLDPIRALEVDVFVFHSIILWGLRKLVAFGAGGHDPSLEDSFHQYALEAWRKLEHFALARRALSNVFRDGRGSHGSKIVGIDDRSIFLCYLKISSLHLLWILDFLWWRRRTGSRAAAGCSTKKMIG
jgi:hypothetical protein